VTMTQLEDLPFARLTQLLESLSCLKARLTFRPFENLWDELSKEPSSSTYRIFSHSSVFSMARLIFPAHDIQRSYNIKEVMLVKALISALQPDRATEQKLKEWARAKAPDSCVLALLVKEVVSSRQGASSSGGASMTLGFVNEQLDLLGGLREDELKSDNEFGRPRTQLRLQVFLNLFVHGRPKPEDAYWLTRCILKTSNGGAAFIREFMNSCRSNTYSPERPLKLLCFDIMKVPELANALGEFRNTAQPSRVRTPAEAWSRLAKGDGFAGEALIELKYDGWRLQVHVHADHRLDQVFTHKGLRISRPLGVHTTYFKKVLEKLREKIGGGGEGAIFDCEVVVVLDGAIEPFGSVQSLKGRTPAEQTLPPRRHHRLIIFDLLMLDGVAIVEEPLRVRRAALEQLVNSSSPSEWVQLSDVKVAKWLSNGCDFGGVPVRGISSRERECPLRLAMANSIAEVQEGIVVKSLESPYSRNSRTDWIKLKRCYIAGMADNLQLFVLGLNYGTGNKSALLSRTVLGARLDGGGDDAPLQFIRVCETGSGLSAEETRSIAEAFEGKTISTKNLRPQDWPSWCGGEEQKERGSWRNSPPQFLLKDANDGILVDVMCSEMLPLVTSRPRVAVSISRGRDEGDGEGDVRIGFSLRFPRIERVRTDRSGWEEVHTVSEIAQLFKESRPTEELQLIASRVSGLQMGAAAQSDESIDALEKLRMAALVELRNSDRSFLAKKDGAAYGDLCTPVSTLDPESSLAATDLSPFKGTGAAGIDTSPQRGASSSLRGTTPVTLRTPCSGGLGGGDVGGLGGAGDGYPLDAEDSQRTESPARAPGRSPGWYAAARLAAETGSAGPTSAGPVSAGPASAAESAGRGIRGSPAKRPRLAVTEARLAVTEARLAVAEPGLAVIEPGLAVTEPGLAVTEPAIDRETKSVTALSAARSAMAASATSNPEVRSLPHGQPWRGREAAWSATALPAAAAATLSAAAAAGAALAGSAGAEIGERADAAPLPVLPTFHPSACAAMREDAPLLAQRWSECTFLIDPFSITPGNALRLTPRLHQLRAFFFFYQLRAFSSSF